MHHHDERESIERLVSTFSAARVLVLGDVILDEYVLGDCSRLSPEAPVPVLRVNGTRQVLGGAGNTAANVAALGGGVVLISGIGGDTAGEEVRRLLAAANVAFEPVVDCRPTARKTRVVGHHQQIVRLDYEDGTTIACPSEEHAIDLFRRHVRACDIVVISDYAKGMLTARLCEEVIRGAREHAVEVLIDPRPQHRDWYYGGDFLTPNWKESLGLLGRPDIAPDGAGVQEVGLALARQYDAHILLTLGAEGMAFFSRNAAERFAEPTVAKEVFDVSGAGDTVAAAFALARGAGASIRGAVTVANRAAGVVVGKFGTAVVTAAELLHGDEPTRLVSRTELPGLADTLRAGGRRIATVNGSFDVLHPGHLHILREARRQGDVLIVGVNSDQSVRSGRGPQQPVVPERDRAEMLLALRCVDYVHIFDEPDPIAFIERVRPDVHVNGAEYGEHCVEAETVARLNSRLHLVERIDGHSTRGLLTARGAPHRAGAA